MMTFIDYLCEMGEESAEGATMTTMGADEMRQMAMKKKQNPKMFAREMIQKVKGQLQSADPITKRKLMADLKSYQEMIKGDNETGAVPTV